MRIALLFNILIYAGIGWMFNHYLFESHPLTREDLPREVQKAFSRLYPGAEIESYARKQKEGYDVYEFRFNLGQQHTEASFADNGELVELEERITSNDLPRDINLVIGTIFDRFEIRQAEKVVNRHQVYYEVKVRGAQNGRESKFELRFSDDARLLEKYRI